MARLGRLMWDGGGQKREVGKGGKCQSQERDGEEGEERARGGDR